jgi:mycothiol synthase
VSVELRSPRLDELTELTAFINRDAIELYGKPEENVDSIRMWLTGPKLDPERDIRVALVDGAFRGYVDVGPDPEPIYWGDLRVPPSEGDDVRVALIDWIEARAKEQGGELLRCHTASTDDAMQKLLAARGYRVVRHFYRMRIELDGIVAEPDWPEGVTVRSATRDDVETAYETHQESFEDHWEFAPMPFEEWAHVFLDAAWFDPTLWFLVEDGGEAAAVALNREHEGESGLGWISVLGVRKQWRRRGLGRALLLHSFHEFARRRFHAAALGVDADSLTGANRLYESAGMRVIRRSDVYERAL